MYQPLADALRPQELSDVCGQQHPDRASGGRIYLGQRRFSSAICWSSMISVQR